MPHHQGMLRCQPVTPTTEQALRGHADRAADWIFVVNGYDRDALRAVLDSKLSTLPSVTTGLHALSLSMARGEC